MNVRFLHKTIQAAIMLTTLLICTGCPSNSFASDGFSNAQPGAATAAQADAAQTATTESTQTAYPLFLPTVRSKTPVVVGIYPRVFLGSQAGVDSELHGIDTWAAEVGGVRMSLLGTFIALDEPNFQTTLNDRLEVPWKNGYVEFINMGSTHTGVEIARGDVDAQLHDYARIYKTWAAQGGGRWAIVAPLQEMNGGWTPYGLDPQNFKAAFSHIQAIFAQEGVTRNMIRWAFAPNGYENPGDPTFESYYPGDAAVSVVSFSSYNYGFCGLDYPKWETSQKLFGDFIKRMKVMAPSRPIYIAETATTAFTAAGTADDAAKNQWLTDSYAYLASQGVSGILYFNMRVHCEDFPIYTPGGAQYDGYRNAIKTRDYGYLSPADLLSTLP